MAYSNDYVQVKEVLRGNIAVVSGLKETMSGDTLVTNTTFAKKHPELNLAGIQVPDPVYFCSIEPPSMSKQKALELALAKLAREDPSLRVDVDNVDSGQTLLSGMGELHLEIILQRIRKEFNIDADLGPLMVAYKETTTREAFIDFDFERKIGSSVQSVQLNVRVQPSSDKIKNAFKIENHDQFKPWQVKALEKGFYSGMHNGPILGYPVVGTSIDIQNVVIGRGTTETMISAGVANAIKAVLKKSENRLLEPIMKLTLNAEHDVVGALTNDLLQRRGRVVDKADIKSVSIITAEAPLAELKGYSTQLRIVTSGRAFFGMEFSHYEVMDLMSQNKAIEDVTGFKP